MALYSNMHIQTWDHSVMSYRNCLGTSCPRLKPGAGRLFLEGARTLGDHLSHGETFKSSRYCIPSKCPQQHPAHDKSWCTMASSSSPDPKVPRVSAKSTADPILRNTLRYTISAQEYETLHKYIISRSKVLKRNAPTVARVEKLVERPGRDDYNAAAIRASLRVFVATGAALRLWRLVGERFLGRESLR